MNLFRKDPPAACPKCGESDGWHCLPPESQYAGEAAKAANPFESAPIRSSFGQNFAKGPSRTGGAAKSKKLRYCCSKCGYEKTY